LQNILNNTFWMKYKTKFDKFIKNCFGLQKCTYFKALEKPFKSTIHNKWLLFIMFDWPMNWFAQLVRFKLSFNLYYLIFFVYVWGKGRHLIYILDVTNLNWSPNWQFGWRCSKVDKKMWMWKTHIWRAPKKTTYPP